MHIDENTGSYATGAIIGGILTFLQENWGAMIVVPLVAGLFGILGKELGKYIINKIKSK